MEIKYGRKKSGIKRELIKKINEWLESITDDNIRKIAEKDVIVTGGSIASMLLGEPVNDYDIYFRTKETTRQIAEYYVKKFNQKHKIKKGKDVADYIPYVHEEIIENVKGEKEERVTIVIKSAGIIGEEQKQYDYFEMMGEHDAIEFVESTLTNLAKENNKEKYRPIFMSQNAITLSDKMQIVVRFYDEPDQIHSNYDFVHATCYWDHHNQKLVLPAEALECLLSRTLVYRGSLYPICSIFRMKKFIERGWRITAGQQLKIMWQISEINMKDFNVLKEQLTGVDQAYMYELIKAIKTINDPEKINSTYISAIIDRIFG